MIELGMLPDVFLMNQDQTQKYYFDNGPYSGHMQDMQTNTKKRIDNLITVGALDAAKRILSFKRHRFTRAEFEDYKQQIKTRKRDRE